MFPGPKEFAALQRAAKQLDLILSAELIWEAKVLIRRFGLLLTPFFRRLPAVSRLLQGLMKKKNMIMTRTADKHMTKTDVLWRRRTTSDEATV